MLRDTSPSRDRRSKKKPFCQNPLCGKGPGTEKTMGFWGVFGTSIIGGFFFFSVSLVFFRPGARGEKKHKKTENGGKTTKTGAQKPAQIPMVLCLSGFPKKGRFGKRAFFRPRAPGGPGRANFFKYPGRALGDDFPGVFTLKTFKTFRFLIHF